MFRFPRTNFHELNLDWILRKIKELEKKINSASGAVTSVNGATGDVIIPVPSPATINPKPLDVFPAIGTDPGFSRGDHVHPMPSAADVGAYEIPSGGIPKTDLASDVQTSLGKADTALQPGDITVPQPATTAPADLGVTANVGNGTRWARSNHVHRMPTASEIGAIVAPSNPPTGAFLMWDGSAWVAQIITP